MYFFRMLPQKNQWICLDPDINSDETIAMNLFNIFLMTAAKFHTNIKKLRQTHRENSQFLFGECKSHLFVQF